MNETLFTVSFDHDGTHYEGRVSPETKHGTTVSWHVVLNEVFFGYLSFNEGKWQVNEQRPQALVEAVGACIEAKEGKG